MLISPRNLRAFCVTGIGAVSYVGFSSFVGRKKLLPERLSRKLMHIGTGSIYMLCWPLYDASRSSPWLCALVPLLASANFFAVGRGHADDLLSITAGATRTGARSELLRGPLLYGLMHSLLTVMFWKSLASVVPLAVLCGGDGLAEVVGTTVKSPALPYNKDKSVAGTLACFVGGAVNAALLLSYFLRQGAIGSHYTSLQPMVPGILGCALVGAIVESLPLQKDIDNVTIPIAVSLATNAFL